MANLVGDRFQITIDKQVREQLGIKPGDRAVEWVDGGRLVVEFLPAAHESMLGILKRYSGARVEPISDWESFFDRAWGSRSKELREVLEADSQRHRTARSPASRKRRSA